MDRVSGAVTMMEEKGVVTKKRKTDAKIQVYGFRVLPLPFIPPKKVRKGMSKEAKKDFYAMPKDAQDWYRRFKPNLGEPEVTPDPEDAKLWLLKKDFVTVPNGERPSLEHYGFLDSQAKTHLDYHDPSSKVSEEEHDAWEDHLESLPPRKQRLIKSFMDRPIDIGQPSKGEGRVGGEYCVPC